MKDQKERKQNKSNISESWSSFNMNNQGVGAEGLLAAQSVLAADGEDFGNDGRVEHLWVLKAIGDCCVHLSI